MIFIIQEFSSVQRGDTVQRGETLMMVPETTTRGDTSGGAEIEQTGLRQQLTSAISEIETEIGQEFKVRSALLEVTLPYELVCPSDGQSVGRPVGRLVICDGVTAAAGFSSP